MLLYLFTAVTAAHANCAQDKRDEFKALLEELKRIDIELAIEARTAFGIVSNYESFDRSAPKCSHIDRLLKDMRETIELYK